MKHPNRNCARVLGFFFAAALLTVLTAFLPTTPAAAWDQHQTFSAIVAQEMQGSLPILAKSVRPVALETFLRRHQREIKLVLAKFYEWKEKTYKYRQLLLSSEDRAFLFAGKAGSLTPERFKRILGVQPTAFNNIVLSAEFRDAFGLTAISPKTLLPFGTWAALFSDEPDWGADIGLFGKGDPRYTEIPFGDIDKLSSQGPFHMYFANENFITYQSRSSLRQSMALLRYSLFQRLTSFALSRGEYYWGARFLGNTVHYLQDMAMPYHSSALPYATVITYVRYFTVKDKDKFLADNMQILANRHFAYEAFGLKLMQLTDGKLHNFISGLDQLFPRAAQAGVNPGEKSNEEFLADIFKRVSKAAYKKAKTLDKVIGKTFPARMVKDPTFDPKSNDEFLIDSWLTESLLNAYTARKDFPQKKLIDEYLFDLIRTLECTTLLYANLLGAK